MHISGSYQVNISNIRLPGPFQNRSVYSLFTSFEKRDDFEQGRERSFPVIESNCPLFTIQLYDYSILNVFDVIHFPLHRLHCESLRVWEVDFYFAILQ